MTDQTSYSTPPDLTGKVVKKSAYAVAGGAFSDVWQGEYEGMMVAIKCPRLVNVTAEKLNQRLYRERQSWARTRHENVLSLLGFCTDFGPVVCFISPWMHHGTASAFLDEHPGSDRIKLLQGLANGLSYIHKVPIVHGDIRGTNILISSEGKAYISDFGLSHVIGHMSASTAPHGSVRWKAPELHAPEKFGLSVKQSQDLPCDVWSFGMTVLELLSGKVPYDECHTDSMVIMAILDAKLPNMPKTWPSAPGERSIYLLKLCQQCWAFQPSLRPSMSDILQRMSCIESLPEGSQIRPVLETVHKDTTDSSEVCDTFGVSDPFSQRLFNQSQSSPSVPMTAGKQRTRSKGLMAPPPLNSRESVTASANSKGKAKAEYVNLPPNDHFPSLHSTSHFSDGLTTSSHPSLTASSSCGEGFNPSQSHEGSTIGQPTVELLLNGPSNNVNSADSSGFWSSRPTISNFGPRIRHDRNSHRQKHNATILLVPSKPLSASTSYSGDNSSNDSDNNDSDIEIIATTTLNNPPISQAVKEVFSEMNLPSNINSISSTRAEMPTVRHSSIDGRQAVLPMRSSVSKATATSLSPAFLCHNSNTRNIPVGVKAKCANCGATRTPLWRRGLHDELNCNACGLYCKLHKRPRPKSMRNTHSAGRARTDPRREGIDVVAQCYNCHTKITPLWRKDDEGKTVCNACGLYCKLHGSVRPISARPDGTRKRSRHGAQWIGNHETSSASSGVSRRASPTIEPDSAIQTTHDYEDNNYRLSQGSLMDALGHDTPPEYNSQSAFNFQFPSLYHPDYMTQFYNRSADARSFASVDSSDTESIPMSPRIRKRRRMSNDLISESTSSDGCLTPSSTSMEFPFSSHPLTPHNSWPVFHGSKNTVWYPPMIPRGDTPYFIHPPMQLPAEEDSPTDYLHPPILPQHEDPFVNTLQMSLPDNSDSIYPMSCYEHLGYDDLYEP